MDKNKASFVQFDIENFYPSITSDLLHNSIQFAKEVATVSDNDIHIIMQSRKTFNELFNEKKPWVKRCGNEDFDIPMGCYNGAEVCELVGSCLLKKVSNIVDKKSIGLYRDDGLAILQDLSGPQIERKRKDIIKILKTAGLNITIQAGLRIVNFLDLQFNLNNGTYQPYRKPNNTPVYINKKSNHPPVVLKQLPKSIATRISDISFDENFFCNSIPIYSEALKKSGFNDRLIYSTKTAGCDTPEKKKRKRKVMVQSTRFIKCENKCRKNILEACKETFSKRESST